MRLSFLGGVETVTGSAYAVETGGSRVLVECGLFQGPPSLEERNRRLHLYRPRETRAVVLTHAHMDHAGLLPALVKGGFGGPVYCTPATKDLCEILLIDSAHIQEMEAEWRTRKGLRRGRGAQAPLYTQEDARQTLGTLRPIPYLKRQEVAPGFHVRFQDAGHILGSAALELWVTEDSETVKLVFSGDVGRKNQPIIRDPQPMEEADVLLVESTYGDRRHRSQEETLAEFLSIIQSAARSRQKVIIPAFAVGRTQEILYILQVFHSRGLLPSIPVYVDSPLAIAATEIFRRHPECFDVQARGMLRQGAEPLDLPNLVLTRSSEESRAINASQDPAIVIAASGMCNAGRILHHLKHNLWRPGAHVVIIGYQAHGTLGRQLVEGARSVRIFHEPVAVRATVHTLGGFSAHADRDELLEWVGHFRSPDLRIFVVHGEQRSAAALADALRQQGFHRVGLPRLLETVDLLDAGTRPHAPEALWTQRPADGILELERRLRKLRKRMARWAPSDDRWSRGIEQRGEEMARLVAEMQEMVEGSAR
jgi:metallo-beta-lactamase family protein